MFEEPILNMRVPFLLSAVCRSHEVSKLATQGRSTALRRATVRVRFLSVWSSSACPAYSWPASLTQHARWPGAALTGTTPCLFLSTTLCYSLIVKLRMWSVATHHGCLAHSAESRVWYSFRQPSQSSGPSNWARVGFGNVP